jgi:hypothetical protein
MDIQGFGIPTLAPPAAGRPMPDSMPGQRRAPDSAPLSGALRDVLTEEERAFFAELEALGPVTYGPRLGRCASVPSAPLGQRIDTRA